MSQISLKSISGITSITTSTGVDNQLTLHTNNTTQAFKLDHAGNLHFNNHVNTTGISTASNFKTGTSDLHSAGLNVAYVDVDDFLDVGSNIKLGNAGIITATSFVGSGANLTNLDASDLASGTVPTARLGSGTASSSTFLAGDSTFKTVTGTTINSNADNRIITGSGTANTLNGESNLTFDGNNLAQSIDAAAEGIQITGSGAHYGEIKIDSNRTGGNQHLGTIKAAWNGTQVARIAFNSGSDTSNKDDGQIILSTSSSGGTLAERVRISSEGYVTKPNTPAFHVSRTSGDVSQNNYVIFNTVSYNNGSHYNNTDGKFTAPVTGIYFFSAWHFTGGTSAFGLRINGSQFGEYAWDDTGGCATWVCPVTANQYVQIYTHKTWRGSASYHNGFCGYLIG